MYSNNLAELLKNQVCLGQMPQERLGEARSLAERALAIKETLDASANIWMSLGILAEIAELEGEEETARVYRRRERESFVAFGGNRFHLDQQFGPLIAALAGANRGNEQKHAADVALLQLKATGFRGVAAIRRIWAGERDWHALAEDIDSNSALLVLRVLETMEETE